MTTRPYVIVGGGPAAAAAIAALRSTGFDGPVVLVGAEDALPYERPPLSKDVLTSAASGSSTRIHEAQWYVDNDVELRLGEAVDRVDKAGMRVVLASGSIVDYDKLLVVTGGRARRLPGVDSERVLHLRDVVDAESLAKRLVPGEPFMVLGGGFIGCEVAASARKLGVEVTVLEMATVPLERALGRAVGQVLADIHRDNGVSLHTGQTVTSVVESRDGLIVTTDRDRYECASLLVAAGMIPNTELVADSSVEIDPATGGISVDAFCCTSDPHIFAAGDVAAHDHPYYGRVRVEHHDNAKRQGAAAARAMVGPGVAYADPHWFWSDQYEHSLQSIGRAAPSDEIVVRGSLADRCFSVFSLGDGHVRSVFALDRGKDIVAAKRLIAAQTVVTAEQVRDESIDLKRLARPTGGRQ